VGDLDSWGAANLQTLEIFKSEMTEALKPASGVKNEAELRTRLAPSSLKILDKIIAAWIKINLRPGSVDLASKMARSMDLYRQKAGDTNHFMSFADFLFRDAFCDKKVNYAPHVLEAKGRYVTPGELNALWSRQVANPHPQPFIVSFCGNVMQDTTTESCEGHVALIIGRDYDAKAKQCTFQILNSWGGDAHYSSAFKNDPTTGTVWLPAEFLSSTAYWISGLRPK
jgi:hypothetical protein